MKASTTICRLVLRALHKNSVSDKDFVQLSPKIADGLTSAAGYLWSEHCQSRIRSVISMPRVELGSRWLVQPSGETGLPDRDAVALVGVELRAQNGMAARTMVPCRNAVSVISGSAVPYMVSSPVPEWTWSLRPGRRISATVIHSPMPRVGVPVPEVNSWMARAMASWSDSVGGRFGFWAKLGFTQFKRRRQGNLQVGGTVRPGVPECRGQRPTVRNLPTPATGGV